jgi:hypothetical protein
VTAAGFGTIRRNGGVLEISCASGRLEFQSLKVNLANPVARIGTRTLTFQKRTDGVTTCQFSEPVSISEGQTLTLG